MDIHWHWYPPCSKSKMIFLWCCSMFFWFSCGKLSLSSHVLHLFSPHRSTPLKFSGFSCCDTQLATWPRVWTCVLLQSTPPQESIPSVPCPIYAIYIHSCFVVHLFDKLTAINTAATAYIAVLSWWVNDRLYICTKMWLDLPDYHRKIDFLHQ